MIRTAQMVLNGPSGGDKALSMPTHDSLRPHDGYGVKDARAAAIKPRHSVTTAR
jgi:hypothetical protein